MADQDQQHVIFCPDDRVKINQNKLLGVLMDNLKDLKTHPRITSLIHNIAEKGNILDKLVEDFYEEQKIIGMHKFILGFWTQEWKR